MNMELQRIAQATKATVVLVTHSIAEAVFLADRVVLLSARPGRLRSITEIPAKRPRQLEVTAEPGTPINCVAQALNEEFAPVGWKVLEIPASEQRTRQFTTDVLTTELGNTGLIYRCWLA